MIIIVTYDKEKDLLHCSVCIAFGKPTDSNVFITGMSDWWHLHSRMQLHEKSIMHRNCAEAYFLRASKTEIKSLLTFNQISAHREQVRKRRQVLESMIDIGKFIGKRGLSFRGVSQEASYTLDDSISDHGNFLELVILLGKYDTCLKEHLTRCIKESKKNHKPGAKRRGKGS